MNDKPEGKCRVSTVWSSPYQSCRKERMMGIGKDGTKAQPTRVARVSKGICPICYQEIISGQAYDTRGGSNTRVSRLVHYDCYRPVGSPTYEELRKGK